MRRVWLVTVDTLRADRMGFLSYPRATTPNLDRIAAQGLVFERAVAQFPKTGPSFASMFTSRYPQATGLTHRAAVRLPEGPSSLPAALSEAGFRTSAVVSNPVLPRRLGWARGFDQYVETWAVDPTATEDPYRLRRFTEAARVNEAMSPILRAAAERARGTATREFFWVHYTDPHAPYRLPEGEANPFLGDAWFVGEEAANPQAWAARDLEGRRDLKYYLAQYDANVRYVDRRIGELFDQARALGLLDDALVIFASDHGESLGEHGTFFDHGGEPYTTTSRVPLLLWAPGRIRAGRVSEPVELIDLFPTLSAILRLRPAEGLEGDDLSPRIAGADARPGPHYAFSEAGSGGGRQRTHFRVVEDGRWKLVFHPSSADGATNPAIGPKRPERWEFFDLQTDPGESTNLAAARPTELPRLRAALAGWMRRETAVAPAEDQGEETLKALKALGYLQ